MTVEEWFDIVKKEIREERAEAWSPSNAAALAIEDLLARWREHAKYGASTTILVEDIKELINRLNHIYSNLTANMPTALDELASR